MIPRFSTSSAAFFALTFFAFAPVLAPAAKAQKSNSAAPTSAAASTPDSSPDSSVASEVAHENTMPGDENSAASDGAPRDRVLDTTPETSDETTPEAAPNVAAEATKLGEVVKGSGTLTADVVRYEGGLIIAESRGDKGVVFQTPDTRVQAERVELDTVRRTLKATGKVFVERKRVQKVKALIADSLEKRGIFPENDETVTETLRGENLNYDFGRQTGALDNARLQLANFTVFTDKLTINGRFYTARNVVLRPGGLSEEELRIYGTPPFSLRAKTMTVETLTRGGKTASSDSASSDVANGASTVSPQNGNSAGGIGGRQARVSVKSAGLYFGKTRLLPVPSYVFNQLRNSPRQPQAFSLTPRINFNSADRVLVTTQLRYGFSPNPDGAALTADLGLSQRVGFRGGAAISSPTRFGNFSLGLRRNDIVTTQLTSRIELDRTPELNYGSPQVPLFALPGGRLAALSFSASAGKYRERLIGEDGGDSSVSTNRTALSVNLTTRGRNVGGPYLDLFARTANYGNRSRNYDNAGFEIGYAGKLIPRVRGALSYRATTLSGSTPFRFDLVEIKRELRSTFDVELSPRYLVPVDLRYDLSQKRLRDQTYGLLRSYKDFAYGVVYQTSRRELRLEIRQGF